MVNIAINIDEFLRGKRVTAGGYTFAEPTISQLQSMKFGGVETNPGMIIESFAMLIVEGDKEAFIKEMLAMPASNLGVFFEKVLEGLGLGGKGETS